MPIYVYTCGNGCGQRVELLTKTASAPIPHQVQQKCPRCKSKSVFVKSITAASIRTPTTTAVARRNDYHRAKPNAADHIIAGRTADGRVIKRTRSNYTDGESIGRNSWKRREKGAIKPELVEQSEQKWGEALAEKTGPITSDHHSEVRSHADNYKKLAQ